MPVVKKGSDGSMGFPGFSRQYTGTILTPKAPGLLQLAAILRAGRQIRTRQIPDSPVSAGTGPADLLACETSGSSGRRKVILRRAASWRASFAITRCHHGITPADRYAAPGSPGHSLALYAMLEGWTLGAGLALLHGMAVRAQAQALRDLEITTLHATPTQLRLLCLGARAASIAVLPRLQHIFMGGGPCPTPLRAWIAGLAPAATLRHFYGTGEASFIAWSDAKTPAGSVGRAYPGVELRLDARHEIWVASPYLFEGYEDEGTQTPAPRRQGRFLATGEIGRLDAAGYLFLRGRVDRMVTVADRNVFPDAIETVIARDPAVVLCAVVSQPDDRRGHRLVGFVQGVGGVVQGTGSAATVRRLRRRCREALGPESVPHRFVFVPRLPLLPAGKPDLVRLAQELAAGR